MSSANRIFETFRNGATWLRADLHLHTKQDTQFSYSGEENRFVADYVSALKAAGIQVGVITNHNKFDVEEFKALRKNALKEEILLLPGVELSVNDGANGVHTLVVFSDAWLANGQDHINPFLTTTFKGKTPTQYEQENGRSNESLPQTIETLNGYHKDYFLVFAHVEQASGLWMELDGGRLTELGSNPLFKERTLGFQKVRTHSTPGEKSRTQVKAWIGDAYPAEVEGSDPKAIDQIGKGTIQCYLKIGDLSFEAVKYALVDHANRLRTTPELIEHSYIESISFQGGVFKDKTLAFSPELNTLIGIRGSGKSAVLECLRYALDIQLEEKSGDPTYKKELIRYVLGSGGKLVVAARDMHGQPFEIHRILDQQPDVFIAGVRQPGLSIRETVLRKPMYFGQKDLSNSGEGFERGLVERMVGDKLLDVRRRMEDQKAKVVDAVRKLERLSSKAEQAQEWETKKQDAVFNLTLFKDLGVEGRLKKQAAFDTDEKKITEAIEIAERLRNDVNEVLRQDQDDVAGWVKYTSEENKEFFARVAPVFGRLVSTIQALVKNEKEVAQCAVDLRALEKEFQALQHGMKEDFAAVQRKIADELKAKGKVSVQPGDFLKFNKELVQADQMLAALKKDAGGRALAEKELSVTWGGLRDLWHEEYRLVKGELDKVNSQSVALKLEVEFKGDKPAMQSYFKELLKGSNVRTAAQEALVANHSDFGEMWNAWPNTVASAGSNPEAFETYFKRNLAELLTWRPPDRFTITFHGKELKQHSLGQRASALILFILSKRDNDVIIIDQPEDDLDNQTIYQDVIKLMRTLKKHTQFIFATHNANFPVLGDADQVHICRSAGEVFSAESGSVDRADIQQGVVDIMEGGEEAFKRRKEIYGIWKPVN